MAKIIIMYEEPKDKEGFDRHYFNVHVPLGNKMPHIRKATIQRVLQSKNTDLNLYLIVELEYDNLNDLQLSLASPEAQVAEQDGQLFHYLNKPPIISIVQ